MARRLLVLHGHEPMLRRAYLPERILKGKSISKNEPGSVPSPPNSASNASPENLSVQERNERDLSALAAALREHRGNVARAAAAIGISRQRAYRLMEGRAELDLDAFRNAGRTPDSGRES